MQAIGDESVSKIITSNTINIFLTAIGIFAISNHNRIRALFDKIASVYFIWKNIFLFSTLEIASPGNQHCASCIDTLSFPMTIGTVEARKKNVSFSWGFSMSISAVFVWILLGVRFSQTLSAPPAGRNNGSNPEKFARHKSIAQVVDFPFGRLSWIMSAFQRTLK